MIQEAQLPIVGTRAAIKIIALSENTGKGLLVLILRLKLKIREKPQVSGSVYRRVTQQPTNDTTLAKNRRQSCVGEHNRCCHRTIGSNHKPKVTVSGNVCF